MKKQIAGIAIALMLLSTLSAFAQKPATAPPVPDAAKGQTVDKMIWDYKTEVSLTDTQVDKLKSIWAQFQKDMGAKVKELQAEVQTYNEQRQKHADLETMKSSLHKITELDYQRNVLSLTFERNVEGILSPDQLTKWRNIQASIRAQAAGAKKP